MVTLLREKVGPVLRAQRQKLRLSVLRVAKLVGVTPNHVYRVERGEQIPSFQTLVWWCRAIALPLERLAKETWKEGKED